MTSYNEIYNTFLGKISDYDFLELPKEEVETIMKNYLKSAIVWFTSCRQDLSDRDDVLEQLNITLTDEEIEILGTLMIIEWLKPRINTTENLKQHMSTKDFQMFSQANHLKELKDLKKDCMRESQQLMSRYSYSKDGMKK
jgi:hypothetical protein